jgi:UTP--glucose-1-phosphate uridylyltransferase
MLLEQAQTPESKIKLFEDIQTFKYFNTNNIWINLKSLKKLMMESTLAEQLPLIINPKKGKDIFGDDSAPDVVQYEQAMGGLIGAFSKSGAVNVSRKRFSPVKTTEDSFRLLSNLYKEDNGMLVMADDVTELPKVKLDSRYKKVKGFDPMVAGVDAINFDRDVRSLEIVGPFIFKGTITFRGENIRLVNNSLEPRVLTDEEISGTKEYGEVSPTSNQGGGDGRQQQSDQGQGGKKKSIPREDEKIVK